MKPAAEGPLSGIRILAVEHYGAGPFASLYLSDMGAEVIKVEDPGSGDSSRKSGPYFLGENDSHFFQTFNLGKKSVALDMRVPEGRAVFEKLVATADAVLNNLRGDQPAKMGLTYEALSRVKPSIVCGHLSGYGRRGERASWPGYDYLMQAEAGFLHLSGEPDTPPARMGLSIVDYLSGITMAFATASALVGALKTGLGRDVDVTLYDVAIHQLTYPATWYLNEGHVTERRPRSGHPFVVPCEMFPTRDGNIFVMCVLPKFWEAFCAAVDRPELVTDERFATPRARLANRDLLASILDGELSKRTTGQWMEKLAGNVPAAPVRTLPEALDNPYLAATGGIQAIDHPMAAGFRVLSNPISLGGERVRARHAPALGADTEPLLLSLGYSAVEISRLTEAGVIGVAK